MPDDMNEYPTAYQSPANFCGTNACTSDSLAFPQQTLLPVLSGTYTLRLFKTHSQSNVEDVTGIGIDFQGLQGSISS